MKRILITGAGGAPSTNFIRSLRKAKENFYIVGTDADKYYLMRAEVDKRFLIPPANHPLYFKILNEIIKKEKLEFMHIQNDYEIGIVNENREKINAKLFLPSKETIKICQNKFLSYQQWEKAGLKIPLTMMINDRKDLKKAFKQYHSKVWIRAISGAGGKGSLPVTDIETAQNWIDLNKGWGTFTASEMLEKTSITWMSIWYNGELIIAQGRKRLTWEMAKISPSGVTGATGTGITVRDKTLDELAIKAIKAIDKTPHGLFAVDMTYDLKSVPNPTEINIGRFFTTHQFFTEAGINMPYIFTQLAYGEKPLLPRNKINPIRPDYLWIRGMDFEPILTTKKKVEKYVNNLEKMKNELKK